MGPVCGSTFCTDAVKRPLLDDILEVLDFSEADIKRGRKVKENVLSKEDEF